MSDDPDQAHARLRPPSQVARLGVVTRWPSDPAASLERAAAAGLKRVVIIGTTADGDEFFDASVSDAGDVVWMLRRAEHALMKIVDGD